MPTPKPTAAHGALGDPPPEAEAATGQAAAMVGGADYESDTELTEDAAPDSVTISGADDNS